MAKNKPKPKQDLPSWKEEYEDQMGRIDRAAEAAYIALGIGAVSLMALLVLLALR